MQKLFTFLRESDSESIRCSHRRRAKDIAVSMSKKTADKTNAATETTLTRPAAQRTVVSKITTRDTGRSLIPTANGKPWSSVHSMNNRAREEDTVQALMDLSLPRFARLGDGALPKTKLWTITEKPPSSPVSARDTLRNSSLELEQMTIFNMTSLYRITMVPCLRVTSIPYGITDYFFKLYNAFPVVHAVMYFIKSVFLL